LPCALTLDGILGFPAPAVEERSGAGAPRPVIAPNGHYDRRGEWVDYDQISRRPGRPEGYDAYLLPVSAQAWVASDYDLDKPDAEQRRAPHLAQVGHGGVDLADVRGTPIRMVTLEHQVGHADVLYVGHLFGNSVVTRHRIREAGRLHDYVLIFGHLEEAAAGVRRGDELAAGDLVGTMGDSDSPELVHLHLEARRLRDGVDAWSVSGSALNARDVSVVVDPRNVLALRAPAWRKPCVVELAAPWRPAATAFPQLELQMAGDPLTIP
jgi:murein DD-endopeptidase MepM/ murein hydrolase activator NlpD